MKGQKALAAEMKARDQQAAQQYQQTFQAAQEKSPQEIQMGKDYTADIAWRDTHDYRTPPPTMLGIAYGPETAARRQAEMTAVPTGAAGMGAANANPTALAMNAQNLAAHNTENDASAYQSDARAEMAGVTGEGQTLMAQDFARKMGLLGDTAGQEQFQTGARIQTQPQSILPMLLSGLIGGAGNFFTGGFSSLMRPATATAGGGGFHNP